MKIKILLVVFLGVFAFGCGSDIDKKGGNSNNVNSRVNDVNNLNNVNNVNNENNENNVNNANNNNPVNGLQECPEGWVEASVNGETECYEECDEGRCGEGFLCSSGLCIPGVTVGNNVNNANNANNVTECRNNADCRADQECVENGCIDHIDCVETSYTEACLDHYWDGCADGKNYTLSCDGYGNCDCFVNGEPTRRVVLDENICRDLDRIHHAANQACGWLVPTL